MQCAHMSKGNEGNRTMGAETIRKIDGNEMEKLKDEPANEVAAILVERDHLPR